MAEQEEWRPYYRNPIVEVSNFGNVRAEASSKIYEYWNKDAKCLNISFPKGHEPRQLTVTVSSAVYKSFNTNIYKRGAKMSYIDGDRSNCRLDNLAVEITKKSPIDYSHRVYIDRAIFIKLTELNFNLLRRLEQLGCPWNFTDPNA